VKEERSEIITQRYEKIARIKERGFNPYNNQFKPKNTIREIRAGFEGLSKEELEKQEQEFSVAGRIVRLNFMGKVNFIGLRDRSGEIQIYLNRDELNEDKKWLLKQLDVGDFIGTQGRLFRTKTGELTIYAKDFTLLTKSICPLPEKWHFLLPLLTNALHFASRRNRVAAALLPGVFPKRWAMWKLWAKPVTNGLWNRCFSFQMMFRSCHTTTTN